MPQANRLKEKSDFDKIFKRGKKVSSDSFNLYYLARERTEDQETPRFGIIVTKKIEKSAVKRNRIKRLFREVLRKQIPSIVLPNLDMVFFASQKAGKKEYAQILDEVKKVLKEQEIL